MTLHVITMDGHTAEINYAEECVNPREWANSTMFCGHRRYALGDVLQKLKKGDCRDEITQEIHHEVKRYSEYVDGEQFEYRIYDNDNNFVTSSIGYEDQEAACDNAKEELEDLVACMKTSSHVTFSQPGLPLV